MIRDLAPAVGRHLSCAVVPNWRGEWPLAAHPEYCQLIHEASEELLLHGYFHRRQRGTGPISVLTERADEMNGLDPEATRRTLEQGQRDFTEVFGQPARGFLPPAWQIGHVRLRDENRLEHVLGFFALESRTRGSIPVATWTWDVGRWGALGQLGHAFGRVQYAMDRGVPTLAIHPRDLDRGYWPAILRLINELLEAGYEPSTPSRLIEASGC